MEPDQKQTRTASALKTGALIAFAANIVSCMGLTLVAPALTSPSRITLFVVMLIISLIGVVASLLAALRAGSRIVGIVVLLLCLTFGGLWTFALVSEVTAPPANDTPE